MSASRTLRTNDVATMVKKMNEDSIEKLLKAAGSRPEPEEEMAEAIRRATHSAWLDVVAEEKRKNQRKWLRYASVAAVLVLVAGFFGLNTNFHSQENDRALASVSFLNGGYQINGETHTHVAPLMSGDTLQTDENSLMSVVLEDKTAITVAPGTELTFTDFAHINLIKGRVYVDSPDANTSIVITTSWGSIEDIGTQYEVEVTDQLTVAMREGKVKMLIDNTPHFASFNAGLGDVLSVSKDRQIDLTQVESTDPRWNWTTAAVPHQSIEGMSVHELMNWASRVTGKEIIYADARVEASANRTLLHGGRVSPLEIDSTLQALLKTTKLSAVVTERNIRVEQSSNN